MCNGVFGASLGSNEHYAAARGADIRGPGAGTSTSVIFGYARAPLPL